MLSSYGLLFSFNFQEKTKQLLHNAVQLWWTFLTPHKALVTAPGIWSPHCSTTRCVKSRGSQFALGMAGLGVYPNLSAGILQIFSHQLQDIGCSLCIFSLKKPVRNAGADSLALLWPKEAPKTRNRAKFSQQRALLSLTTHTWSKRLVLRAQHTWGQPAQVWKSPATIRNWGTEAHLMETKFHFDKGRMTIGLPQALFVFSLGNSSQQVDTYMFAISMLSKEDYRCKATLWFISPNTEPATSLWLAFSLSRHLTDIKAS